MDKLPKVYAYSSIAEMLFEQGMKSEMANIRHGALKQLENLINCYGVDACDRGGIFPAIAGMSSDGDQQIQEVALSILR